MSLQRFVPLLLTTALALGASSLLGCSPDDDGANTDQSGNTSGGNTSGSSHGIANRTAVNAVSASEMASACTAMNEALGGTLSRESLVGDCLYEEKLSEQCSEASLASCGEWADGLIAAGEDELVAFESCEPGNVEGMLAQLRNCNASWGDFNACMTALTSAAKAHYDAVASVTTCDAAAAISGVSMPAECTEFNRQCPGSFEEL